MFLWKYATMTPSILAVTMYSMWLHLNLSTAPDLKFYSAFGKSLCTYKRRWKWCPRAPIQAWTRLTLFANAFCRSTFGKSLCTYKRCWKWCPRAPIQAWTCLISLLKQFHTLPVLHFNRCLTTECSETTAHFNGNFDTDNQIYVL
jgi:hypothetical protein